MQLSSTQSLDTGGSQFSTSQRTLQSLGLLVLCTWLVARSLCEGLPGNLVGFDEQLGWLIYAGAFLSQFLSVSGATVAIRQAAALVSAAGLVWWVPTLALVSAASASTYALFSAQPHDPGLDPRWLIVLGAVPCAFLLFAAVFALRHRESRGSALLCLGAGAAAWVLLGAKVAAYVASENANTSLFLTAQLLATLSFAFRASLAVAVYVWWLQRGPTWVRYVASGVLLVASALWVGQGREGIAPLLLATLQELGSDPTPLISDAIEGVLELFIFSASFVPLFASVSLGADAASPRTDASGAAGAELSSSTELNSKAASKSKAALNPSAALNSALLKPSVPGRVAVSLALLGSVVPDQPLGALVLTLSALALLSFTDIAVTSTEPEHAVP